MTRWVRWKRPVKCQHVTSDTWSSYGCHRDAEVEYDGRLLCKIHAGAAKRSAKAREKRDQQIASENNARDQANRTIDRINAASTLDAHTYYDVSGKFCPDRVVVDMGELRRLLRIEP